MITDIPVIALSVALSVIQPPQPVTYKLGCDPKWTHWVAESSVDLIHWQNRYDIISTNADGTNCELVVNLTKRQEFFRVVGEYD